MTGLTFSRIEPMPETIREFAGNGSLLLYDDASGKPITSVLIHEELLEQGIDWNQEFQLFLGGIEVVLQRETMVADVSSAVEPEPSR